MSKITVVIEKLEGGYIIENVVEGVGDKKIVHNGYGDGDRLGRIIIEFLDKQEKTIDPPKEEEVKEKIEQEVF